MAKLDASTNEATNKRGGVNERIEGLLLLLLGAQNADEDTRVAKIRTHFDLGHGSETNARIPKLLSNDRADLVLQFFGQSLRTV